MKKIFVVFVQEQNGKYYAIAETIKAGENLVPFIERYNSKICHLCESRKQANDTAVAWNASYKTNGTCLI